MTNTVNNRPFKGALRSHEAAVKLGVIDPRIRALVDAFNWKGVTSSVSSCEGHRLWGLPTRRTAFVMFSASPWFAAQVAARIGLDYAHGSRLHHYWKVDAAFDGDGKLIFNLNCPNPRFHRNRLDADFRQLKAWVEEILQARHDALTCKPEVAGNNDDYAQKK